MFAQPERMVASHYAAHANFVCLQLFNGHKSVFVCFLAIRLLHLYGWSGGWYNPWHLFREGGVCKEPEVEPRFCFFFFFLHLVRDHVGPHFIWCHLKGLRANRHRGHRSSFLLQVIHPQLNTEEKGLI